ncbi:hypothetical protein BOH66_01050 [Microbacterium aurum]|uniref:RNA polymerase sigma-70 region 4 domain-containing protein n=1 Tax=Microbacterium aurum TaxID=36805 RepID=A0A1P8U4J5_9MICO|nr:sigma-70 family RNA polymerase sigma factor [Microbacterium aurum]APZ33038.1 hypothetical protein BOH66_01050 [Microbacterium aurum]MBM7826592.1 RNA polymerase sigma-70 factor (ECF subfamily) [Microbacterium aurum]
MDIGPLYLQHRDTLHRVAASVLREVGLQGEKQDVVSDAMLSLSASPPTEQIDNWEAYLVRVVKNKAYDRIRAADVIHFGRSLDVEEDERKDRTEDVHSDADERIDAVRVAPHLHDSMAALTARERFILTEALDKHRTQGEIAEELGVSRPRVNQILNQALQKLRDDLESKGVIR